VSQPWMKWYPADWRADPRLRMCSLAARGLWADLLSYMHEGTPYGHLTINGMTPSLADIAALVARPLAEVRKALAELEERQVFSREGETIYSRRMVRDNQKATKDRESGKRGGNPALRKGVNPPDNDPHKAHLGSGSLPSPSTQEVDQGTARASQISGIAFNAAKDLLALWKLDEDEPRMHGLPYYVQGWMNAGAELLFIMSKCANLSPKNLAYLNAAMLNAIEERKTEPLAKPEGNRNVRTASQTSGSIADAARKLGAAGVTFGPRPGGPRLVSDGAVIPLLSER